MKLTVTYPESGTVRIHRNLTQPQINKLITHISDCQDTVGEVAVRAKVEDDGAETPIAHCARQSATVLDFHAGERH